RLQDHKNAGGRPRLRITRHWIWHRAETRLAPEAAEKLGQTRSIELLACIEQTFEHLDDASAVARARESERRHRVVVGPHRTVVIAHRIVTLFVARERANSPSGIHIVGEQSSARRGRTLAIDQPGGKTMSAVGRHHPAWASGGVERRGDHSLAIEPEVALERSLQRGGAREEPICDVSMPKQCRDGCHAYARRVNVALHLRQRDRRACKLAVVMKDRVSGILPALVVKAARGFAHIFDVTVAVAIAPSFDPLDSPYDVGPELAREPEVPG